MAKVTQTHSWLNGDLNLGLPSPCPTCHSFIISVISELLAFYTIAKYDTTGCSRCNVRPLACPFTFWGQLLHLLSLLFACFWLAAVLTLALILPHPSLSSLLAAAPALAFIPSPPPFPLLSVGPCSRLPAQ